MLNDTNLSSLLSYYFLVLINILKFTFSSDPISASAPPASIKKLFNLFI